MSTSITSVERLVEYLQIAMQLEHATIPPYLTALYSIHPQTNADARHVLRVVVVEEMLHLTLAANLMNAVGGSPDLRQAGFVPTYPTPLPDGEHDFEVSLQCFSESALQTFLKIERPSMAGSEAKRRKARPRAGLGASPQDEELDFYSIGDFYEEIRRGFAYLYELRGPSLFSGDPRRQVTSEYYYSGGGELMPVTCIDSANAAIALISGQGEGDGGGIYDKERELAHFYRFEQLVLGRFYQPGDEPHKPTGPECAVDWNAVYPTQTNPRVSQLCADAELHETALAFNREYADFLGLITDAYNGKPQLLMEAVPKMFSLRNGANVLIRNPLPESAAGSQTAAVGHSGGPVHAAPTFEISQAGS